MTVRLLSASLEPFWTSYLRTLARTWWWENSRGQQSVPKAISDAWHAYRWVIDEEERAKYTRQTLNLAPDPCVHKLSTRTQEAKGYPKLITFTLQVHFHGMPVFIHGDERDSVQKYQHRKKWLQFMQNAACLSQVFTLVWDCLEGESRRLVGSSWSSWWTLNYK